MVNINFRTSKQIAAQLERLFANKSQGSQKAVEGFMSIRKQTLAEIKCLFDRNELSGMATIQKGTKLMTEYQASREIFLAHIEDAQKLDNFCDQWKIDYDKLVGKIRQLNASQVFFLQDEIDRLWTRSSEPDLDKFLDEYAGK